MKLVCINPNEITKWEFGGAEFDIGVLPRAISRLILCDGKDPQQNLDNTFTIVKWGCKGHKNLPYGDGSEVPFTTTKETLNGKEYDVVSEETLDMYHASDIINPLAFRVFNKEGQKDAEVENTN